MSSHLLDLSPIKEFSSQAKLSLPVSIAHELDDTPFVVSRFGDDIWDFYPYIPQENLKDANKIINWAVTLPDGQKLTDDEHAKLLESAKDFIWSLFCEPVDGSKRPKMQTLINKFKLIQPLLRWMVSLGLNQFAQLEGKTLNYVPIARKARITQSELAGMTVQSRLNIVEYIYYQRSKLKDAIQNHPWPHETSFSLAGVKRGGVHRKPTTEIIPDHVVSQLSRVAIDYVQKRSGMILKASRKTDAAAKEKRYFGRQCQTDARTHAAMKSGYTGMFELRAEKIRLRTACYIVINMFSGIRNSEMTSLSENCITRGRSLDDTMDILWLHGTIYKTNVRAKKWLVPPIVAEAVEVLTRLTAPLKAKILQDEINLKKSIELIGTEIDKNKTLKQLTKRLHTASTQKNKLFLALSSKTESISVLSGTKLNFNLKDFCAFHNIRCDNSETYRLHSHQFRRTYARFVAKAELGDLLTLRDHFGHWSIDMTIYYCEGGADEYEADTELLEMVSKEKSQRKREIVGNYLESDAPLANGNHWMKDWRMSVRTAKNKKELMDEYASTITLNGTGHSWCIGNAKGAGCGGLCVFEAQMCVDCNYAIIGQEHRPVWEGIRDQQLEALALDDMGYGGRERAQALLESAEKVLRRLDGQESS
jgi:integrase